MDHSTFSRRQFSLGAAVVAALVVQPSLAGRAEGIPAAAGPVETPGYAAIVGLL